MGKKRKQRSKSSKEGKQENLISSSPKKTLLENSSVKNDQICSEEINDQNKLPSNDLGNKDVNDDDADPESSDEEGSDEEEDVHLDGTLDQKKTGNDSNQEKQEEEIKEDDDPKIINVSFDFCDPNEKYFHSVKGFLTSFLPGVDLNASDFADLIVSQASVGTLVCSEYDDVFAFITVLNMDFRKESSCIQRIRQTLEQKCPEALRAAFQASLQSPATGLVVSRRMVNLPLQLISPLHTALVDDIAWAKKNEISEEHRKQFELDKLLFIAPCEVVGPDVSVYYSHFEEEIIAKGAELSFLLNAKQRAGNKVKKGTTSSDSNQNCCIFVISMSKYQEAFSEIQRLAGSIA